MSGKKKIYIKRKKRERHQYIEETRREDKRRGGGEDGSALPLASRWMGSSQEGREHNNNEQGQGGGKQKRRGERKGRGEEGEERRGSGPPPLPPGLSVQLPRFGGDSCRALLCLLTRLGLLLLMLQMSLHTNALSLWPPWPESFWYCTYRPATNWIHVDSICPAHRRKRQRKEFAPHDALPEWTKCQHSSYTELLAFDIYT